MEDPGLITRLYHTALRRVPSSEVRHPGTSPILEEYRREVQARAMEILERKLPGPSETRSWELEEFSEKEVNNRGNPRFSILTWNIKKGMNLDGIIDQLRKHSSDILCLQEVDWDCVRTGRKNVALEIARCLGYRYTTFSTEFVEIQGENDVMPYAGRKRLSEMKGGGLLGRATLSRYPIKDTTCLELTNKYFDWQSMYSPGPRTGQRISQKSIIRIGDCDIAVYNTHLENLGGMEGRREQWQQVYDDADKESNPVIVLGDLNTLLSGALRVHPEYFDPRIFNPATWFESEARRWKNEVFDKLEGRPLQPVHPVSTSTCSQLCGAYRAKLDWVLIDPNKISVQEKQLGSFGSSDHRPLMQTLTLK